jgi:hypothetical protein
MRRPSLRLDCCRQGADAAPPIPPAVEKSVIDIVESVAGGKDLALPSGLRPLSAHEIAVVKGFAGCAPNRNPDSTVHEVITDWTCPSDNEPRAALATRSITLRFDYRGQMFSFELNPSTLDFNPTSVALANRKLPSPAKQTALFRDAIEEGGDITLAGLVPLTDLQVAEFEQLQGCPHPRLGAPDEVRFGKCRTDDWQALQTRRLGEPSISLGIAYVRRNAVRQRECRFVL